MADWAAIITASVGVLTPLGGGAAFVWNRIEKRFTAIDQALDQCRAREHASEARRAVQLTVIELLWQEVERLAPGAKVLGRAKKLLDELKEKAELDALTSAAALLQLQIDKEKGK